MESEPDYQSEAKMLEAILRASASGSLEVLDDLLFKHKGRDILGVCRDESGRTPLHLASANGHRECVESLLVAGHAWNAVDDSYVSAGELAKQNGHEIVYEILLQAGIRTELLLSLIEAQMEDEDVAEDEVSEFDAEGNPLNPSTFSSSSAPLVSDLASYSAQSSAPSAQTAPQHVSSSSSSSNAEYLGMPLQYSPGGTRLLDADKNAVMMDWEGGLMREHARILCERPEMTDRSELHIMNVGFGLGLVDEAIQSFKPARHTIIEAHPDVYAKMLRDGWAQRPGVKILFGRWQDFLMNGELESYDGIFWDTFGEHYRDQKVFHDAVPMLLKPEGIFSFFNGLGGTNQFFHDVYCRIVEMEFAELGFTTEYVQMDMDTSSPALWEGVKRRYWSLDKYNLPIIRALPHAEIEYDAYDMDDEQEEVAIQAALAEIRRQEEEDVEESSARPASESSSSAPAM